MSTLVSALLITAIGMGLVFVAILLLWGLMELVVKIKDGAEEPEEEEVAEEGGEAEVPVADANRRKRLAAAAAVAVALAMARSAPQMASADGSQMNVSSWQAVRRAAQLSQSVNVFNRKYRGR